MDHVHINVGEIITDQFKRKAKQQATGLPFPNLMSMLCMRATCPLFRPLDRTLQANAESHNSPPANFLNNAQRAKMHENWLVWLAKALPSMLHNAIKKSLLPAKDKFASLCSTIDVLESEVRTLKQEVAALTAPPSTSQPNPFESEVVPEAPRSSPDDWW
ncbi:hypothetical protein HAX54_022892, partial [Datura stramonium]|nr:hypothetical protein [Datura stramonium]